jgi:prepilin-type N-terminal cleavage/methylation domain-containing protein
MSRFSVRKPSPSGFTLIETLVVLAIIGILSALAIPSFIAIYQKTQLTQSVDLVAGSLREAQFTAMRRRQNCDLTIDKRTQSIGTNQSCLATGDRVLPNSISLDYTGTTNKIQYGIRGNTTTNKSIMLGIKDVHKTPQKCITISAPLGIIRVGDYDAEDGCVKG